MNFLIVEDQDFKVEKIRTVINEATIGKAIELYVSQNVSQAVEFLSGNIPIDLLILDLNLPVREGEDIKNGSGLTVIKEINRRPSIIRPGAILGLTAANPINEDATRFFKTEGWALISYNVESSEWEETITNKINYMSEVPLKTVVLKRRILYVGASPKDQDAIGVGTEQRRIEDTIRMGTFRDDFEIIGKQGSTFEQLSRELMVTNPEFLHFSGHGDANGIAMEDQNGLTCYVPLDAIDQLLTNNPSVKCILLNSCYSSDQAKALSLRGIYVLGNSESLPSNVAEEFSVGFYQAIVERKEVHHAFGNGTAHSRLATGFEEQMLMKLWFKGEIV